MQLLTWATIRWQLTGMNATCTWIAPLQCWHSPDATIWYLKLLSYSEKYFDANEEHFDAEEEYTDAEVG